jgi:hypothetical protein
MPLPAPFCAPPSARVPLAPPVPSAFPFPPPAFAPVRPRRCSGSVVSRPRVAGLNVDSARVPLALPVPASLAPLSAVQPSGGVTSTILLHLGHSRMAPITSALRTASRAWQVVQVIWKSTFSTTKPVLKTRQSPARGDAQLNLFANCTALEKECHSDRVRQDFLAKGTGTICRAAARRVLRTNGACPPPLARKSCRTPPILVIPAATEQ